MVNSLTHHSKRILVMGVSGSGKSTIAQYAEAKQQNRSLVIACSALKARYREVLRGGDDTLFTVYLDVNPKVLIKRMETRKHFMPPALLKSQLNTLELPTNENNTLVVDATIKPSQIIVNINQWLEQYS